MKSRGYQGLPLDLYTKYLDRYFHGSYIPKNLCKNLNDDIDYLTCWFQRYIQILFCAKKHSFLSYTVGPQIVQTQIQ